MMSVTASIYPITYFILMCAEQLCRGTEPGNRWKPLVLVIPLRLGLSEINPIYVKGLKVNFTIPHFDPLSKIRILYGNFGI